MDTLEQMISEIYEEKTTLIEKRLVEANNEKKRQYAQKIENEKEKLRKQHDSFVKEMNAKKKQAFQGQLMNKRNQILQMKQEKLEQVFLKAQQELENMSEEEMFDLLRCALHQIDFKEGEIVLGELNASDGFVNHVKEFVKHEFSAFSVSENMIPREKGFILKKNGIEYNFTISQLLREVKEREMLNVSNFLWTEGES